MGFWPIGAAILLQNLQEIKAKANSRQYDALIGVTTADWFHSQGSRALREGITEEERDRFSLSSLPCLWDHHCHYHCQHLFALHIYNHQASTVLCDEQLWRTLQRNLSCRAQRVHQLGSGKSQNHPLTSILMVKDLVCSYFIHVLTITIIIHLSPFS